MRSPSPGWLRSLISFSDGARDSRSATAGGRADHVPPLRRGLRRFTLRPVRASRVQSAVRRVGRTLAPAASGTEFRRRNRRPHARARAPREGTRPPSVLATPHGVRHRQLHFAREPPVMKTAGHLERLIERAPSFLDPGRCDQHAPAPHRTVLRRRGSESHALRRLEPPLHEFDSGQVRLRKWSAEPHARTGRDREPLFCIPGGERVDRAVQSRIALSIAPSPSSRAAERSRYWTPCPYWPAPDSAVPDASAISSMRLDTAAIAVPRDRGMDLFARLHGHALEQHLLRQGVGEHVLARPSAP